MFGEGTIVVASLSAAAVAGWSSASSSLSAVMFVPHSPRLLLRRWRWYGPSTSTRAATTGLWPTRTNDLLRILERTAPAESKDGPVPN